MADNNKQQTTHTYTLLSGTHLSHGKVYHRGDTIELTEEQAARFEPGRLQTGGKSTATSTDNKPKAETTTVTASSDVIVLLDQPPIKAITDINALTDLDTLNAAKVAEESGQKRAGVIKAITSRIDELSKSSGGGAK